MPNGDYAARVCRVEAPRREEIDRGEMREVLNGVLWILRIGAVARSAGSLSSVSTCHRRFQQWQRAGV